MNQENMQQGDITQKNSLVSDSQNLLEVTHKEQHIQSGEYLKSSVYGGLDGAVNTLTVIIAGIASGSPATFILSVGISVMIGDGIGMGLGDYLSAKAQKQFIKAEQQRQLWQVQNKLQAQKRQVVQIYQEKGYSVKDSKRIAQLFSTNKQAFVNIMMLQQLGLVVDDSSPLWNGVVTLISFIIFGFLPLIPYVISAGFNGDKQQQFLLLSLGIGAVQLFSLGFAKATLIGLNKLKSGFETLFLGAVAVAVGYGIGVALQVSS